jgi:hypothetical protein
METTLKEERQTTSERIVAIVMKAGADQWHKLLQL